jgi:hypothetical protein
MLFKSLHKVKMPFGGAKSSPQRGGFFYWSLSVSKLFSFMVKTIPNVSKST